MVTYNEMIQKTRSRKTVLATVNSVQELKFFTDLGSNNYEKTVNFFVVKVEINGTNIPFTYQISNRKLSFSSALNPSNAKTIVTFKHFYSSTPLNLPNDLSTGADIEWEGRLVDIGELKLELDYENQGIALESNSSITLENNDEYFDEIFDTHIWENQDVAFYYYFDNLPANQAKLIYKGSIESKTFNPKQVKFQIKDKFYQLRNLLKSNPFTLTDGSFNDSLLGRPKRKIYGEVSRLKINSISQMKGEIRPSNAKISGANGSTAITGTICYFYKNASVGDTIFISGLLDNYEYSIASIDSDNQITISEPIEESFSNYDLIIKTDITNKHYNRRWQIAGHKLHENNQSITNINSVLSIDVTSSVDFEVDDYVEINGSNYIVRRVVENTLFLNQNISPAPIVGNLVKKIPCFKAYFGTKELVYGRDFSLENGADNSVLVISSDAEKNITPSKLKAYNLVFTNGSRVVTTSDSVDLKNHVKTRDLIKPSNISYTNYYEVLTVDEQQITLRELFNDSSITSSFYVKEISYIEDDSLICVDCVGKSATTWIRYPSEIVENILVNDAEVVVNSSSFLDSKTDGQYKVSVYFPETVGSEMPTIKDAISKINASVFGSLCFDSNFDFKYSVLNANRPSGLLELKEDDVLSYESITSNRIISIGQIEYLPQTNLSTEDVFYSVIEKSSDYVNLTSKISNKKTFRTLLFSESDASMLLDRYVFFNSLANSIVKIKAKLNLSSLNLNDVVQISFDRIYKRFGGKNKTKIGLINSISKDETQTTIQINDVSGLFNRVPSICPDSITDIATTSESDIAKYGFIVDNDNETPDNTELYIGSNLIG